MTAQKSLASQKVAAYVSLVKESQKFWDFLLVFLAALLTLSAIQFYPFLILLVLAAVCGAIAYRSPPIGLIILFILAFPAVIYQSAIFGWIFLLIIALVLFEAFSNWKMISILLILIMAPFSFGRIPYVGLISVFGMVASAFYFGSRKSILVAVPSVLCILLLSSLFLVQNSAFMPINLAIYSSNEDLLFGRNTVGLMEIGIEFGNAFARFVNPSNIGLFFASLGIMASHLYNILISDSGLIQIIGWVIVLYLVSFISGRLNTRPQFLSSLVLLLLLPIYYFAYIISATPFNFGFPVLIAVSIIAFGLLEQFGFMITREAAIERSEKMKTYGKFGFKDVGATSRESLSDVGGYGDVKQELKDAIIMPLEKRDIAHAYGMKPPSGILLFGPPGTGKTMLMRALAKELKYNFVEVKCSQILSQWYGESEKNIVEIFNNARKTAPTILFFDEIDSIGKKRSAAGTDEVTPRVLSALLQEMDGAIKTKSNVIVVGTTNVPNQLDPALLRPGRFDKIIYMRLPNANEREEIFKVLTKNLPLDSDIDFKMLAKKTERFSGADISNVVKEAKRMAAKEASSSGKIVPLSMDYFLRLIKVIKPSTTYDHIEEYERFRMDFERSVAVEEKAPAKKEIEWKDVAGMEDVKKALLEAIQLPLLHEDLMKKFEIKPSKGVLLFGPPGTGKTLLVKAAANELNVSFQSLSGADLMKRGPFQATSIIKEAFNRARENVPAILFIDEIETFAPARGTSSSEIVGQFLTEMDGVRELKGVVVIAATNRPDLLDSALLRPGRFDKIFYIPPPDEPTRKEVFRIHLGEFVKGIDLQELAKSTEGFSGADIASACQQAKMLALRQKLAGEEPGISTILMKKIISARRPSITAAMLRLYYSFLEKYGERK